MFFYNPHLQNKRKNVPLKAINLTIKHIYKRQCIC